MSRRRERIETNALQTGLNAALAGLDVPGLPAEPVEGTAPPVTRAGSDGALPSSEPLRKKLGRVVLRREKAQRGGKTVIVIHDFPTHLPLSKIEEWARMLRAGCGCGGTVRNRTIEVQGDQPGKIRALLEREGFQVAGVS